jgi:hypothetical protein
MTDDDKRLLEAQARVARQRELIARLEARRSDTSEAKSLLSALRYSLRILKRHQRRRSRSRTDVPDIEQTP